MSELLDFLDQGIGICDLESLRVVEANSTLVNWLDHSSESLFLADFISNDNIQRIQKSIKKGRKFRFSCIVTIKSRKNSIDFNTSVNQFANG